MVNTIVFDVNETLLDISALEPEFERIFGDGAVIERWFLQLLHYSLVANIAAHISISVQSPALRCR
jgi:2-haloacid dehalogenase